MRLAQPVRLLSQSFWNQPSRDDEPGAGQAFVGFGDGEVVSGARWRDEREGEQRDETSERKDGVWFS